MRYDITAIGEILIDLTMQGKDDRNIELYSANPGGAPANVAVAAAKLGAKTAFVGRVGSDHYGDILRETLMEQGVDCRGLSADEETSTTLAVVSVDQTGERSFFFYRNPGADLRLERQHIPDVLLEETSVVHFGSVSLTDEPAKSAVLQAVRDAKKLGKVITYDPNYRKLLWRCEVEAKTAMRGPLALVDILKISDEEVELMTDCGDLHQASEKLLEQGISLVLITLGADGVYYRLGEMEGRVSGVSVKVADTNGAGDTFFGSFLSRLTQQEKPVQDLTRQELEEMLTFANHAAALTTSRPGAIPAMPTLCEVNESLAR